MFLLTGLRKLQQLVCRGAAIWAMTLALTVMISQSSRADFTLELASSTTTISAGQSMNITVQLVTGSGGPVDLDGFTATLFLTNASSGLTITKTQMPGSNYVFQGNSFDYVANPLNASGVPLASFPAQGVAISDLPNDAPYYQVLGANQTYSLGVLTITAAAGIQTTAIGLQFDTSLTELDGDNGSTYSFKADNDMITPTPAPPSLVVLISGALILVVARARRARLAAA